MKILLSFREGCHSSADKRIYIALDYFNANNSVEVEMKITIAEFFNQACFVLTIFLIVMVSSAQAKEMDSAENTKKSELIMLALIAYNYTDRTIASYQINGAGGGDVSLSSSTSGGSGTTCCVQYEMPRKAPIHVLVR